MNRLITAVTLIAMTAMAVPASAESLKFNSGPLKGHSLEYKTWNQAKCDTYLTNTRFRNLKTLENCIGKMSKREYAKRYGNFLKQYKDATDDRVNNMRALGAKALVHPDVKWKSPHRQEHLNNGKIAASVIGGLLAAPIAIHGIATVGFTGLVGVALIFG